MAAEAALARMAAAAAAQQEAAPLREPAAA
jgi:hypothetical protein